jgi:hypothetical protein
VERHSEIVVLGGLAALLLITAIASGWRTAGQLTRGRDAHRAAEAAAAAFVEAYGTFDFREEPAYRQRLLTLTAGPLYQAIAASQADPVAIGQQRVMQTQVLSTQLNALSVDAANVLVTAEQLRHLVSPLAAFLEERSLQRVACRLVREDGRWLVVEFRLLSEEPAAQAIRH